jgi:hypothetical protein
MSSEIACQAVASCEGLETSLAIVFSARRNPEQQLEIPRLRSE